VFVRDRVAGTTEIISLSTGGVQANCQSGRPSINADGRFVAFHSCATNWIPGKVQALNDIFVRDRLLGTTEWINPPLSGGFNNHHSGDASISDDGRYVAFMSLAGDIAPTTFNVLYTAQIYTRDRQSATTEWTSVCSYVSGEAFDSYQPSISGDGRFVAYESDATTAVAATPTANATSSCAIGKRPPPSASTSAAPASKPSPSDRR
jgi:Tol biopolymer transport system component